MNKDVISITPEDDITDVITQIKASEKKIVAIVPPKPAGIFRSVVNIKLIAKVSEEAEKVPVLITSDKSLIKLAQEVHIPVAEDLNSRPHVPTDEDVKASVDEDEEEDDEEEEIVPKRNKNSRPKNRLVDDDEEDDRSKKKTKNSDKKKKKSKLVQKFPWLEGKGALIIVVSIVLISMIGFLVWAFVIAPKVTVNIKVSVKNGNNFSESVTFTENESLEDASSGKFYLQKASKDFKQRMNFTATGKKDLGDKASGKLTLALYFDVTEDEPVDVKIPAGTEFRLGDLEYESTKEVIFTFDPEETECENGDSMKTLKKEGCQLSKEIAISAKAPGEKYNIEETRDNWSMKVMEGIVGYGISNFEKISGGSSKIVTIVLQEDVDKIKQSLSIISDTDGKAELYGTISTDSNIIIESTFKSEDATFEVSPAVGEEVKEGTTPVVIATRPFSVMTVDIARVDEFVKKKISLPEDQKIYSVGTPFIEYFSGSEGSYTGKLKTIYKTGPNISEDDIFTKIAGRKVGEAKSILSPINGVEPKIETSLLLNTIPTDRERVEINIEYEE